MTRQLIIHIGTGKTGSTAIQSALNNHADILCSRSVYYWGLNLEGAMSAPLFPWQSPHGIGILQRIKPEEAKQQLSQVLMQACSDLPADAVALWSNESIYERPQVYIPVIRESAISHNIDLRLVCFARQHRSYVISAYKQWGIKHKTYRGPIQGFKNWTKNNLDFLSFGRKIAVWDKAFGGKLHLINYESTNDVLADFLALLPAGVSDLIKVSKRRPNASLHQSLLSFFALYNNQFQDPVPPRQVEKLLQSYSVRDKFHQLIDLNDLYPDREALDEVEGLLTEDISLMDTLMQKHHQPLLSHVKKAEEDSAFSGTQACTSLVSILLTIILKQEERINKLENKILDSDK